MMYFEHSELILPMCLSVILESSKALSVLHQNWQKPNVERNNKETERSNILATI